jgi:hypothetical protein
MSGTSPKQLEANQQNAQHSTGHSTPTDGVAPIPDRGWGQASYHRSQTVAFKPLGVLDEMLVEKIAVAYCRWLCVRPSPSNTFRIVLYQNAIERQLHRAIKELRSLQDHRCLSNLQPSGTPPIDQN